MKNLADFNLEKNPFQHITPTPGANQEELSPWAGMPSLYSKIENVYRGLLQNTPRQVVLNWGPYGGGKTFAAYHFIENYGSKIYDITQIYIRSPKSGKNANKELYDNIINYLSVRKIKRQVKRMIELMGEDELFDFLQNRLKNEEIVEGILKIATDDPDEAAIMKRYIFSNVTATELKKVGLAKKIDWGTDSIKFLAGIILCFTGDQDSFKGRVVIWIDEMEDMIYYSQKEYRAFSQVLRDLIDQVNQYFTLFFNFTLAETEEQTIELLLGSAMWSRIDKKIRFSELDDKGALEYCKDLLNHFQIDSSKGEYSPFGKEVLETIWKMIPNNKLTPREINRYCSSVLNFAISENADEINLALVAECFEAIAEDE